MALEFQFLTKIHTEQIVPLIQEVNDFTSAEILTKRVKQMFQQNYYCLGIYEGKTLVGICGMWYQTRHYSGYSLEVDHVVIAKEMRSKGVGKQLFEFIEHWAKDNNFEAIELNTYKLNTRSHTFYEELNFIFKGRHYVKMLIDADHPLKQDTI